MILNSDFLSQILDKYNAEGVDVHITDETTRVLASTNVLKIGTASNTAHFIVQSLHSAVIENPAKGAVGHPGEADAVVYGTPFFFDGELGGTVIVKGPAQLVVQQGNLIRAALETAFDYQQYDQRFGSSLSVLSGIAAMLLSEKVDEQRVIAMMNRIEMDPQLLRCVVCINLEHHQNSYFNINLSLGYQASIQQIMEDAAARLQANRYLNSQDIVYICNRNTIVVIKSFIPVSDLSKIYLSLDAICHDLEAVLASFTSFSFNMAYGNLYQNITELKKSLNEASQTIDIGRRVQPNRHLYVLENILFDNICCFLHPQIVNKLLLPIIQKLTLKDGSLPMELMECAEAFVDNCMSLSQTADKIFLHRNTISARLGKLKQLTGLDPAASFNDAFMIKMLVSYVKLKEASGG